LPSVLTARSLYAQARDVLKEEDFLTDPNNRSASEMDWWMWYRQATNDRALPFWAYDARVGGFMRCYITEQPKLSPAGNSTNGCYVTLSLFVRAAAISVRRFVTESDTPNLVIEGADNSFVYDEAEVSY